MLTGLMGLGMLGGAVALRSLGLDPPTAPPSGIEGKCKFMVGDMRGYYHPEPVSAAGWARTIKKAYDDSKRNRRLTTIDMKCDTGGMAMAQCSTYKGETWCGMEGPQPYNERILAGLGVTTVKRGGHVTAMTKRCIKKKIIGGKIKCLRYADVPAYYGPKHHGAPVARPGGGRPLTPMQKNQLQTMRDIVSKAAKKVGDPVRHEDLISGVRFRGGVLRIYPEAGIPESERFYDEVSRAVSRRLGKKYFIDMDGDTAGGSWWFLSKD